MGDLHGNDGAEDSDWHIPSDEDQDANSLLAPEPGLRLMSEQQSFFRNVENWSRMLNAGMTPVEQSSLENSNLVPEHLRNDLKKVIRRFGQHHGANAPCRRLLQYFATNMGFGTKVGVHTIQFTLVKHLILAERAGPQAIENRSVVGCSCLAESYFMLEGCIHSHNCQIYKEQLLVNTLCPTCSICLRCKKWLGI